jgi:UDP-N-acetylmuramate-alanine ligase
MAQLNHAQLDDRLRTIHNELAAFRDALRRKHEAEVVGQTVLIQRTLKDPVSGDKHEVELTATIKGLRWSYEDDMLMVVTYTHPFTGKVAETEEGMG